MGVALRLRRLHLSAAAPTPARSRRILLLGRDDRSTLAILRSLGRAGHLVDVGWHDARAIGMRSRYVGRAHDLPAPDLAGEAWLPPFRALLRREAYDLVLPADDPATLALAAHRAELEPLARLALPNEETLRVAYDKRATWRLARALDIPVPAQLDDVEEAGLAAAARELGWPVVLKPRHPWCFGVRKWEHTVRKAYGPDELLATWRMLRATGEVLLQRNVPGHGVGVEVLAHAGEVLLAFQHERLHEPPRGGGGSYRRSVPLDPRLEQAARNLAHALALTGVAMFEFKLDRASEAWHLIEINARFWGSLPLSLLAGADFPRGLVELWLDARRAFPAGYRTSCYARNLWRDLWWFGENRRVPRDEPTLARVGAARLAAEVLPLVTLREGHDSWAWDDPRPGLSEIARIGREVAHLATRKASRASRAWNERRRGRRARRDLAQARRVLFVCKGNLCRSPFAGAVAARLLPDCELRSAGYWREGGRACPPEAVVAARAHGVDLSEHRSRVLAPDDVAWADLIVVFDDENRRALAHVHPDARSKVHLLGALAGRMPLWVPDPWGGPYERFRDTYAQVSAALARAWSSAVRPV